MPNKGVSGVGILGWQGKEQSTLLRKGRHSGQWGEWKGPSAISARAGENLQAAGCLGELRETDKR